MSQGFHKGNIFSFSDEFERPQQNHIAQQSRRDKLRVLQQHGGFDAAAEAAGHPLVAIQEDEEEEAEEEEEDVGIYGRPAGTSNMLISEMFNFPAPDELIGLHLTAAGLQGAPASSTAVMMSCQQRRPADSFYGCNNRPDQGITPSSTSWSSVVLAAEDSAAAVAKHHGIMNPDSSAGTIRRFFDNSSAAGVGRRIQPPMQQLSPSPPISMGGGGAGLILSGSSSLHDHHPHRSQTSFLGPSFGECLNLVGVGGEVILERQLGRDSLSLSSSELQQLEMTRAENQMRVSRSEQGDHSFFFLNSSSSSSNNQHQDDELPAPQPFFHQQAAACNQQGHEQAHMSYGPVAALSIFRNSLYARAAQELLEEFCSVGRGQYLSGINKGEGRSSSLNNPPNYPSHIRGGAATSSAAAASSWSSKEIPPLSSADRFESQRKKSKLLSMLDEVERRYNHYCEQMQMVVNSFESAMGLGAATPYTALAHKAMSRHFRCLKDAITGQLKQTCELLGDKLEGAINGCCSGSGGLTKVETPKLRLIDQSLRQQQQQRALLHHDHLGMMDQAQPAWRPQRGLPDRSVTMLRAWLFDHFLHPYPSDADKHLLARQTGLTRNQVSNWFINARVRLWKPMVEDMYQKEAKEAEDSQQQQQHNDQTINTHTSIILSAATTRQHDPHNSPTLILQPNTYMINSHPQPQPEEEDDLDAPAASPLIFSPHNDMYRRPAAMLGPSAPASQPRTTTTGDLSLTLGLRHAGLNPPETGRFGL